MFYQNSAKIIMIYASASIAIKNSSSSDMIIRSKSIRN